MEQPRTQTQLAGVFNGIFTKDNGKVDLLIRRPGMNYDDHVTMAPGRTQPPPQCQLGQQVNLPVWAKPYTTRNNKPGFYYDLIEGNGSPASPPPVARPQASAPPAQARGNGYDSRDRSIVRQSSIKCATELVVTDKIPLSELFSKAEEIVAWVFEAVPSRAGVLPAARPEVVGLTSQPSAPAGPAPSHGYGVLVTAEPEYHERPYTHPTTGTQTMKRWWKVKTSDGSIAATYSTTMADDALAAYRDQLPINYEASGEGNQRVFKSLEIIGAAAPELTPEQQEMAPPDDASSIPF